MREAVDYRSTVCNVKSCALLLGRSVVRSSTAHWGESESRRLPQVLAQRVALRGARNLFVQPLFHGHEIACSFLTKRTNVQTGFRKEVIGSCFGFVALR